MSTMHAPPLLERPHRSAAPLYTSLAVAGGICLAGLVAQVVAAMAYNPISIFDSTCPDEAWPAVSSLIALFTTVPAGIFLLVALANTPLIWAGDRSETVGRAVTVCILAAATAAVFTGSVFIWLGALASTDCVAEPASEWFMQALAATI
ncbi:MAG TPA: hypothetical protein VFP63_07530 [Dehalococcoidia bacterium]|nr:hypothetical protein [Dehalococcoidia bacterium]